MVLLLNVAVEAEDKTVQSTLFFVPIILEWLTTVSYQKAQRIVC